MDNALAQKADTPPIELYLQQLDVLSVELETGFRALAKEDLARLNASVAQQEILTAGLTALLRTLSDEEKLCIRASESARSRMLAVANKLRTSNLKLSALLKHSARSVAVFQTLCRSHSGLLREQDCSSLRSPTWSCEM